MHSCFIIKFYSLQFIPNFYKFFRNSSDEAALKELVDFFQRLENIIKAHGENGFLGGIDKPGAVDYLVWPWIERSLALKILSKGIVLKTQLACMIVSQLMCRMCVQYLHIHTKCKSHACINLLC